MDESNLELLLDYASVRQKCLKNPLLHYINISQTRISIRTDNHLEVIYISGYPELPLYIFASLLDDLYFGKPRSDIFMLADEVGAICMMGRICFYGVGVVLLSDIVGWSTKSICMLGEETYGRIK